MVKKIAIQGWEASFHDIAATKYFGAGIEIVPCDTFEGTFKAVEAREADYAVCAIENSLYGSINATYDLLVAHHFSIVGEVYLRVEQCLIVLPGTKLTDIEEVHSHPVALAQCEDYLDQKLPKAERLEYHDTAASVAMIKEQNQKHVAAIASRQAAKLHGMEILAESIETNKQNYTRFIVLSKEAEKIDGDNKTSLIIKTSHQPGALYKALGVFAGQGVNLSKLQSRPIIGKAWHYVFYADVEANLKNIEHSLQELKKQNCQATVLGSYVAADKY